MAVNHADGTMVSSLFIYPIAAMGGAADAGAGWYAALFFPVGLLVGFGVFSIGRVVVYGLLGPRLEWADKYQGWVRTLIDVLLFFSYLVLPIAIMGAGLAATWFGSSWMVSRLL